MKKHRLRGIGLLGLLVTIPLFAITFANPQSVERAASSFIEWKLNLAVNEQIDSLRLPEKSKLEQLMGDKADTLRQKTERQLEEIREKLRSDYPAIMAEEIARVRNLDCECRKKWEQWITVGLKLTEISLEAVRAKLINFTHAKYMEIVTGLLLELRIFLGTNALVFVMLLLLSFVRPLAMEFLFPVGILLFCSVLICAFFYLFEQNWFFTILFGSYVGFAYAGFLVFVFLILCDIGLNEARVIRVVGRLLGLFSGDVSASPC